MFTLIEDENEQKKIANRKKGEIELEGFPSFKGIENNIWALFYKIGPIGISDKDDNKNFGGLDADVYAYFGEFFVIAQVKSGSTHSINKDIEDIIRYKDGAQKKIWKQVGKTVKIVFILFYSNRKISEEYFVKARKKGVILWSKKHYEFYLEITKKLKNSPIDIIMPDLLHEKPISKAIIEKWDIIAMKGKQSGHNCYSMMLSPQVLKRISYVNKRHLQISRAEDVSYQRFVDPKRLDNLRNYLLEENSFIPSSIIINFETPLKKLQVSKKLKNINESIETVHITLPSTYGSAYIIDGQHRVYGYYDLEELSRKHVLHVVAFEGLSSKEQAKMFVDINQNQKPISPDVLWDLYDQLYVKGDVEFEISHLIKKLVKKDLLSENRVFIPSLSSNAKKSKGQIGINTLGRELLMNKRLLSNICNDEDFDKYSEIVILYFNLFASNRKLRSDIKNGDDSFILSNAGIAIIVRLLNNFDSYLQPNYANINSIKLTELKEELKEYTSTIVNAMDSIGLKQLNEKKKESSSAAKNKVVKEIFEECIELCPQKFHFAREYAFDVHEDIHNEFKSYIRYDLTKDRVDESLFFEGILGTIVAFINSSIEGNIYIGIDDNEKFVGLKKDMEQHPFNNKFDEANKWIVDKIKQHIKVKDYNLNSIVLEQFNEDPLVLKLIIPRSSDEAISILVNTVSTTRPQYESWVKTSSGKQKFGKNDFKKVLTTKNKQTNYSELFMENVHE